jgi:hypothetical protein
MDRLLTSRGAVECCAISARTLAVLLVASLTFAWPTSANITYDSAKRNQLQRDSLFNNLRKSATQYSFEYVVVFVPPGSIPGVNFHVPVSHIRYNSTVFFGFNRWDLEAQANAIVSDFAKTILKDKSNRSILVVGHTPPALRMEGIFDGGGAQGLVRLALFASNSGVSADGWLAFVVGRETLYLPFHGEYSCQNEDCRLTGTSTEFVPPLVNAPYFRRGDRIVLSGKKGHVLQGSLQPAAREVFQDNDKQAVKYQLRFSSQ